MNKVLVVSLVCSENFLPFGEVLEYTWEHRIKSKYPFELLVTDNVSVNKNDFYDSFHYKTVYNIEYKVKDFNNRFNGTLNKFWSYLFTDYDYVVFLDADNFILSNIDDTIDTYINLNEDKEFICTSTPVDEIYAGFFIVKPNVATFLKIMSLVLDTNNHYFTDGAILTDLYMEYTKKLNIPDLVVNILHDSGPNKLLLSHPEVAKLLINCTNEEFNKVLQQYRQLIKY